MSQVENNDEAAKNDNAVAQGGAYDVIKQRLVDQGKQLKTHIDALNDERLNEFGATSMEVAARVRIRTENNCTARDIVQIGDNILFGYNVFIGLKKETAIGDVFSLYHCEKKEDNYTLEPVDNTHNFLHDGRFKNDFEELYRYYKNTKLVQLVVKNDMLLAAFQIGDRLEDIRVFRWSLTNNPNHPDYVDNRGERDIQLPSAYDFEWTDTSRDDVTQGRYGHINILDSVFVDNTNGILSLKIENNTDKGHIIFSEELEDKTQSLNDAKVAYAKLGDLIVIRVIPYQEKTHRYFVFNTLTEQVLRIDEIGESCQQLPEDHGIIFPGGYYLQTGEYKAFDDNVGGFRFKRVIRSPNGEDTLFVFYEPNEGAVALLSYNLIEKTLRNPIFGHGYALYEDGRIIIFTAESEPSKVHPMQIWHSAYVSSEFASKQPLSQNFYGRIGNAPLVRGISDLYSLQKLIQEQSPSLKIYEELVRSASKLFDNHYWLNEGELKTFATLIQLILSTAELVIDEFEKVQSIRDQSNKAMLKVEQDQEALLSKARFSDWETVEGYVETLAELRQHRGQIATTKSYRYINTEKLDTLDKATNLVIDELSERTVNFLAQDTALAPYEQKVRDFDTQSTNAKTTLALDPILTDIQSLAQSLDLISELIATLNVADATVRTKIIDDISSVYAQLNQSKAKIVNLQKKASSAESSAQFSAQFKLFSQTINNALSQSTTPEKCDENLARLLVQLEEFESQFSEIDEFLAEIIAKRDEVHESFEAHKQQLLDDQQRKANSVVEAAQRILSSIEKRSLKMVDTQALNTFFVSDMLVAKVRDMVSRLRHLNAAVHADDIEAKFKALKEQAIRALRDKTDIFEDGGKIIKLGPKHKFSVNLQELDLTIIPKEDHLDFHLTGTNFFEPIDNQELNTLKPYWNVALESESPQVYRSEYLAYSVYQAARKAEQGLTLNSLRSALKDHKALTDLVSQFAAPRYKEGYEKGIHDNDAACILAQLIPAIERADTLLFSARHRAIAQLFWGFASPTQAQKELWSLRAQSSLSLYRAFASLESRHLLISDIVLAMQDFFTEQNFGYTLSDITTAADYLIAELALSPLTECAFATTVYADKLIDEIKSAIDTHDWDTHNTNLQKLSRSPAKSFTLSQTWLSAYVKHKQADHLINYIDEAAVILCLLRLPRRRIEVDLDVNVTGLLGQHTLVVDQSLKLSLTVFNDKLREHCEHYIPNYRRYLKVRSEVILQEKSRLRLDEFKPRPLSSFVRNRLINESYLPIIGDNLAKQMGTIGESKRSDLMGLLMMISPPGYGKTTLMEYVASRLGLIFMKINCPSLGHDVVSLDPEQANDATAAQELIKLNLSLEMGNNVMLYLDDIQHTNPEFLQKFISLCDGTRRIDGIWKGKSKTYDMRGKKFCVVMAGNPYTESGEAFKVPDMLANRADIYNLGDILGGMEEQFAMSYIENSLTSNPVLAPMALRPLNDVYLLMNKANGESIATSDLSHNYSSAELEEISNVLQKMFVVRDVILKINQQYIISAAQNDHYRTEPPFKLQGSYRNMNKMAEKISSVMTQHELLTMIGDHYQGEAQLLMSGSEDNLLKLAELRDNMTPEQAARWAAIKKDFTRNKENEGDADGSLRIVEKLGDVSSSLVSMNATLARSSEQSIDHHAKERMQTVKPLTLIAQQLHELSTLFKKSSIQNQENIENRIKRDDKVRQEANNKAVKVDLSPEVMTQLYTLFNTLEQSANSLTNTVDKSVEFDRQILKKITKLSSDLKGFAKDHRLIKRDGHDELDDLNDDQ